MNETPSKSKNTALVVAILATLLVILLFKLFPISRPPEVVPTASVPERHLTMSGKDIAKASASFFEAALLQGGEEYSDLKCDGIKSCSPDRTMQEEDYYWKMLALTGLYKATGDLKYFNAEKTLLKKLEGLSPLTLERRNHDLYNLHQIAKAVTVFNDPDLLNFYAARIVKLHTLAVATMPGSDLSGKIGPMLRSTYSREFADAYKMFSDEASTSRSAGLSHYIFSTANPTPYNLKHPTLINWILDDFLQKFGMNMQMAESEMREQLQANNQGPVQNFACFVEWARWGLYKATGDKQYRDGPVKLVRDLKALKMPAQDDAAFQTVLPCIEIARDLANESDEFRKVSKDLLQDYILSSWDYAKSPLCSGSNGFLSRSARTTAEARKLRDPCVSNILNIADSAWAVYLLSDMDEKFNVL